MTAPGDPLAARIERPSSSSATKKRLRRALDGVDTLFNTYWVRFAHGETTFGRAVENTRALLRAAQAAGARRVVHVSVTNPSLASPLPYFRGKAEVERDIAESALSSAIVRPTLVFGPRDILVNNIAWGLRRSPVFPIAGDGSYRVQPVSVDDTATICVDAAGGEENVVLDAAGPETISYEELVRLVAAAVGSKSSDRALAGPRRARPRSCDRRPSAVMSCSPPKSSPDLQASLLVSDQPPLRKRQLQLVGRRQRRDTRPRLRLGARA